MEGDSYLGLETLAIEATRIAKACRMVSEYAESSADEYTNGLPNIAATTDVISHRLDALSLSMTKLVDEWIAERKNARLKAV